MSKRPLFAVINPRSPNFDTWIEEFGTDVFEVESNRPFNAVGPDGVASLYLKARISSLTPGQLARLAVWLVKRWSHVNGESAYLELLFGHGLPILATDVYVCRDASVGRAFWRGSLIDG